LASRLEVSGLYADPKRFVSAILLCVAADLVLGLGTAVVKVACKIWLKDYSFASDASSDVVDIVKERVSGELDQRKAQRLFEDLEEPVAKKLEWLRRHEMAGMPDNEWTAAVLVVGDTLRQATFSDADIFAGDLDPLYLRRKVAAGSPNATRDLSEAGTEVYRRLLTECCALRRRADQHTAQVHPWRLRRGAAPSVSDPGSLH